MAHWRVVLRLVGVLCVFLIPHSFVACPSLHHHGATVLRLTALVGNDGDQADLLTPQDDLRPYGYDLGRRIVRDCVKFSVVVHFTDGLYRVAWRFTREERSKDWPLFILATFTAPLNRLD